MPANNVKFVVGTVNIGCFRDATLSLWFVKLPEVATESVNRVARWLSQNYRTLTVSMLVPQNIELFTLALSSIAIILTPDKGPKYRTVRLNERLNERHVLRHLFPSEKPRIYDLRPRAHNFILPEKDDSNFIPRVLFRF